jgi:hypothetical protein
MPDEQPTHDDITTAEAGAVSLAAGDDYEPLDIDGEELQEPEQLPRRPRRRLLSPIPLALIGVLLIAAGFIGGVLVEKGQGSSGSSAGSTSSSFASRLAGLRGGPGVGAGGAAAGGASAGSPGAGGGRPVAGQVAYLSGSALYVTSSEGNTVKVLTSAATSVSKTAKATVKEIHPGETVTVTGSAAANGTLTAESISVGAGANALAALLGGVGSGSGTRAGGASGGGAAGAPTLFGKGG